MAVDTLELNDSAISLFHENQLLVKSPGFTVHDTGHIYMGIQAQQRARLLPRQLNHKFWSQLNLDIMSHPMGHWERHADIAHAHLLAISEQANNPEQVILAVPGSYDSYQLALILGMCRECPFDAIGLVDGALAASVLVQSEFNNVVHLDLQLHQAVVTRFEITDDMLVRTNVTSLPEMGIQNFYDDWARFLAKECIQQTRFHPLHKAVTEQSLYNELPQWLSNIETKHEDTIEFQGYQFRLNFQRLLDCVKSRYDLLQKHIQDTDTAIILSHRVQSLPGFSKKLPAPVILKNDAVALGVSYAKQWICTESKELEFITALRIPAKNSKVSTKNTSLPRKAKIGIKPQATHLLWKNKAYPLIFHSIENDIESFNISSVQSAPDLGLYLQDDNLPDVSCEIRRRGTDWWLHKEKDNDAFFSVIKNRDYRSNSKIDHTSLLNCGDVIRLAGFTDELTLIEVVSNNCE